MSEERILKNTADWEALARKLSKCPEVSRYDTTDEKEAWTLAHAFADLEQSFRAFLDEHLPKLVRADLQPGDMFDLLLDIGEEFRHVLYHIEDPRFYKYLTPPQPGAPSSPREPG